MCSLSRLHVYGARAAHWGLGLKRNCLCTPALSLRPGCAVTDCTPSAPSAVFRSLFLFARYSGRTPSFSLSFHTARPRRPRAIDGLSGLRNTPSPPPPLVLLNLPRELIDAIAASLRALRGRVKVAGAAGLFEAGRCLEARRKQESCPRGPESNVLCMLAYQVQSRGAEGQVVVRVREAI